MELQPGEGMMVPVMWGAASGTFVELWPNKGMGSVGFDWRGGHGRALMGSTSV